MSVLGLGEDEIVRSPRVWNRRKLWGLSNSQGLPTNIAPTNIAWLKSSGKFPMDMRIPPLRIKIMLIKTLWNP